MRARLSMLFLATLLGPAGAGVAQTARIDLGSSGNRSGFGWNNLSNTNAGSAPRVGLIDTGGGFLPWGVQVTRSFSGISGSGGSASFLPGSASSDGFFGAINFNAVSVNSSQLTFSGLDNTGNTVYDFRLYGSRTGVSDNRSTFYSLSGSNSRGGGLSASNNFGSAVNLTDLRPNGSGQLFLDVSPASTNNHPNRFFYLNSVEVTARRTGGGTVTPPTTGGGGPNMLFYGNSFTRDWDVPGGVANIAAAAGRARPNVVRAVEPAQSLSYHLAQTRNNPSANINAIASSQNWDVVVMQEESLRPTRLGNRSLFRSDAVALYNAVRARSWNVKAVLFETWARKPGTGIYGSGFSDPYEMQADLRDAYYAAAADINSSAGRSVASVAQVGDVWGKSGFNNLHVDWDDKHANPRGALLASLTLYAEVYRDNVSDIPYSSVSGWVGGRGIDAGQWRELTGYVDAQMFGGWARAVAMVPEPAAVCCLGLSIVLITRRRRAS
jgi:hypothetical protein